MGIVKRLKKLHLIVELYVTNGWVGEEKREGYKSNEKWNLKSICMLLTEEVVEIKIIAYSVKIQIGTVFET